MADLDLLGYNPAMELSIIIPAYEESRKVARDVQLAGSFLQHHHFTGEVIVVDDASRDDTSEIARSVELPPGIELRVIRYEEHRGKGYAVRTGMSQSKGRYAMFADSGSCVPYEDTMRGLDLLRNGECDIAHGSRKMRGCHIDRPQSLYRRICSKMFHWFVVHYMGIDAGFTDTQCGFKMYKGDVARHLYGECVTDGFTFDIEVILRAHREGYRIKEFPLDWSCDRDSRLSPTRNSWRVLSELLNIKRALKRR